MARYASGVSLSPRLEAGGRPVDLLEELSNVVQNDKNGRACTRREHVKRTDARLLDCEVWAQLLDVQNVQIVALGELGMATACHGWTAASPGASHERRQVTRVRCIRRLCSRQLHINSYVYTC